jgi:D-alanine-D-alanine ligase
MKIGLTYDLRNDYLAMGFSPEETAEFDRSDTVDSIERALNELGYATDRIGNIYQLTRRLNQGAGWDLVFNIAEGLSGIAREAQIPALLDAYMIPYTFSDTLVLALTMHKGVTKHLVRAYGVPTPDFAVVECETDIAKVRLPGILFAKPVAEGTGKGISPKSKISTPDQLYPVCCALLRDYAQPVIIETFLPGREFTVGIVGTGDDARTVGVMEIISKESAERDAYSYFNKEFCEEHIIYALADDALARQALEVALDAWKALGCRDGGRVDLRADARGAVQFLEVNPLAGLHPHHSDLPILCGKVGITYTELIGSIVESALKRHTAPGEGKKKLSRGLNGAAAA